MHVMKIHTARKWIEPLQTVQLQNAMALLEIVNLLKEICKCVQLRYILNNLLKRLILRLEHFQGDLTKTMRYTTIIFESGKRIGTEFCSHPTQVIETLKLLKIKRNERLFLRIQRSKFSGQFYIFTCSISLYHLFELAI